MRGHSFSFNLCRRILLYVFISQLCVSGGRRSIYLRNARDKKRTRKTISKCERESVELTRGDSKVLEMKELQDKLRRKHIYTLK